ncbi:MAG: hypothetical protein U5L02_21270, partial [Rheinheimera sp.]|nr:hypothetical protein [Rheinheimera sp.]
AAIKWRTFTAAARSHTLVNKVCSRSSFKNRVNEGLVTNSASSSPRLNQQFKQYQVQALEGLGFHAVA